MEIVVRILLLVTLLLLMGPQELVLHVVVITIHQSFPFFHELPFDFLLFFYFCVEPREENHELLLVFLQLFYEIQLFLHFALKFIDGEFDPSAK